MKQLKLGYIGKSFALGAVGVIGTIIAACGGGGVTATAQSSSSSGGTSPYVLYASMYEMIPGATGEPFARTTEGGNVYGFFQGNFSYQWGLGVNADYLKQRQAYGVQGGTTAGAPTNSSAFGLAIRPPANSTTGVNISQSGKLVIQLANGTTTDAYANSHMTYTIALNAGTQDQTSYAWTTSCSYDHTLTAGSRPGTGQAAWVNTFGFQNYTIPLSSFTCTSGDLATMKNGLKEVVVKVVGGKDATASAVAVNSVLLQVGHIAFSL